MFPRCNHHDRLNREPNPALVARDFLVQLTSAKELGLDQSALPLMVLSFRGVDPEGAVATWSVVLDQDRARDLTNILAGATFGSLSPRNRVWSRRFRRRLGRLHSGLG